MENESINSEPVKLELVKEIRQLIDNSRINVAIAVNAEMTLLYWNVGKKITMEILKNKRAEYGKQIVQTLSAQLTLDYGRGWSEKQLRHCLRFAETFPDYEIVYALRRELSWTHIRSLIFIDDALKRDFYIEMCKIERWSSRVLQERIQSMLYERTAISRKPELTFQNDLELLKNENKVSPDLVFRDPYFLDFLGLKDVYSEKDLESAIIVELQKFIIELGSDFAFLDRQKRISIDNRDYYIDLLFYHRRLKCLIAIDLKIGEFEAANKGQMELYLRYLEKYMQLESENTPIGLILCTGKNEEHIELLQLHKSNIRIADYYTILPPKKLLQEKLHKAIEIAQSKFQASTEELKNAQDKIRFVEGE
jgi:predicted nuclease of restriction endonuclease-like (RecB) superfamily